MACSRRLGPPLPLAKNSQRKAQIVLGSGPGEGVALARVLLKRQPVSLDGLLQTLGAALAQANGPKCKAQIVLGSGPGERVALARVLLKRQPVSLNSLLETPDPPLPLAKSY